MSALILSLHTNTSLKWASQETNTSFQLHSDLSRWRFPRKYPSEVAVIATVREPDRAFRVSIQFNGEARWGDASFEALTNLITLNFENKRTSSLGALKF